MLLLLMASAFGGHRQVVSPTVPVRHADILGFNGHPIAMGNVNVDLLTRGTPDQVEACVMNLLRKVAPGGGYILSSGNSVASYTQVDNVRRMCDVNYRHGRYPINL